MRWSRWRSCEGAHSFLSHKTSLLTLLQLFLPSRTMSVNVGLIEVKTVAVVTFATSSFGAIVQRFVNNPVAAIRRKIRKSLIHGFRIRNHLYLPPEPKWCRELHSTHKKENIAERRFGTKKRKKGKMRETSPDANL